MFKIIILFLLSMSLSFASTQTTTKVSTRTGDFPAREMKAQNKKIVTLVAKEISQTLPQKIDKYTTLSKVVAIDTTLVYTFLINTGAKSDAIIQKEDRSRMKAAVTIEVCQSSRKFLEAGINTSYLYLSEKTKVQLFRFDISQSDCIGLVH